MYLNGVNVTPDAYHGQGTADGTDIYRDVVTVGRYQYYQFTFATNLFKVGTNTFTITIRQPGASGSWSGSAYPELLQGGLIYDFLQMETGPQVILATPPAAPAGLTATAVSRTQVNLVWTNLATNALSIAIERSTDHVNFTQIGAVPSGVTNYADASPLTGVIGYYQVVANNADGNSPASNIAQADTPPAAPANLNASPGSSQITLTWSASAGTTNYTILRGTSSGNETNLVATTTNTTATDSAVCPGTNYYYVVLATGPFGSSLNSAEVSAGLETPPVIGHVRVMGGQLVLTGSGGVTNGVYYVLTATNLAAPLPQWTRLLTNPFDAGGNFNFTNAIPTNAAQNFYRLQLP
jgi:hypothetical protein